ncbi:hypothetical protein EVAR_88499_1 [Eumeta japonica]|uniref:Uncharacterized protein n=1 Tax=Eumeta variegata TaxID=151549 RepID=A0A4C1XVV6_EUMVA|nr:hypothetical protein EVAR_88499_1 [Eumeta japonica]
MQSPCYSPRAQACPQTAKPSSDVATCSESTPLTFGPNIEILVLNKRQPIPTYICNDVMSDAILVVTKQTIYDGQTTLFTVGIVGAIQELLSVESCDADDAQLRREPQATEVNQAECCPRGLHSALTAASSYKLNVVDDDRVGNVTSMVSRCGIHYRSTAVAADGARSLGAYIVTRVRASRRICTAVDRFNINAVAFFI